MPKAPVNLPEDIVDYVSRNYAEADRPTVMATLENAKLHDGSAPDFRMFRCLLVASNNSLARVQQLVSLLAIDYRDVIVAGEYDSKEGDLVKQGETIAQCGNSGNTTQAHLHLQLQNTADLYNTIGAKLYFDEVLVNGEIKRDYMPQKEDFGKNSSELKD